MALLVWSNMMGLKAGTWRKGCFKDETRCWISNKSHMDSFTYQARKWPILLRLDLTTLNANPEAGRSQIRSNDQSGESSAHPTNRWNGE
jgi:hypothetical protein